MEMGSRALWNLICFANSCMHKSWCVACTVSVGFVRARGEIPRTPTNARGKSSLSVPLASRVLSRIYLSGEKPKATSFLGGTEGMPPPRTFFEMNMC